MNIFKSKTIWFSFLLSVFGAVEASFGLLKDVISPEIYGYSFIVIGAIVAGLRFLTTKAIGDK